MRRLWQRRGVRVVGALIALIAIGFVDMVVGTPNARAIRDLARMPEATKVFDVNGQLAFTIFQERRLAVPLSSVSPDLIHAVLAIEDQRFYRHRGVDAWRIGGALLANLRGSHGI